MFTTRVIIREDVPLNIGESTLVHNSLLEVSKGSYKGTTYRTLLCLVTVLLGEGQKEAWLFLSRSVQGGD